MVMALLLDFANIAGGLLLAAVLLQRLPKLGPDLGLAARAGAPYGWIVGLVALVTSGYYLLVHLTDGPRVFHFEIVGLGVGVALLWDRLRGRRARRTTPALPAGGNGGTATRTRPAAQDQDQREATGGALLLAVFGVIAIIVGFQGLLTPDY